VLLLTEVPPGLRLPGYRMTTFQHLTMALGQHYAAVAVAEGLDFGELEPPSVTSAGARVGESIFISTVLPWPNAKGAAYVGATQAEQTERCLDELEPWLAGQPSGLVWGGDWNHPLNGSLSGFTRRGHDRIATAVARLGLTAHTAESWAQETQRGRHRSIDHIASRHEQQPARSVEGRPFSTHDAYVVDLPRP